MYMKQKSKNNKPTADEAKIDEAVIPKTPVTTPEPTVAEPVAEPVQEEIVTPAIDLNAIIDQLHGELDDTRLAYNILKEQFETFKSSINTDYVPKADYNEKCHELAVEIQKNQGPQPKLQAALDQIQTLKEEKMMLENELSKTNELIVEFFTSVIPSDILAEFIAKYQDNEAE